MPKFKESIIKENTVINCETENQAIALMKWAQARGLKWRNDQEYCIKYMEWDDYKIDTCYYLHNGSYADKPYYIRQDFDIISYEDAVEKDSNA